MQFNPAKVSLMAFAILFKMLSAHCDLLSKDHFLSNVIQINFLYTGLTYTDKTDENKQKTEENEIVKITGFTDSVYAQAPDIVTLTTTDDMPKIKLSKSGLKDFVVWNPYENAAKMSDMHEDAHLEFVCVEATQTSNPVILTSGQTWEACHSIEIL